MAYDKKYRQRVLEYKESGHTFKEVKEAFGVDHTTYHRWKKQIAENGCFVYRYPKEHTGKIDIKKLIELVKEHPDWYLREYAAVFGVCHKAI